MGMEDAVIDATSTAGKMSNDMSSLQQQEDTIKKTARPPPWCE